MFTNNSPKKNRTKTKNKNNIMITNTIYIKTTKEKKKSQFNKWNRNWNNIISSRNCNRR